MTTISWYDFNQEQEQKFSRNQYKRYSVGEKVSIQGKNKEELTVGYVIGLVNDAEENGLRSNGLNAYVISQQPINTPAEEVTDIAILYQGSSKDFSNLKKGADAVADWTGNFVSVRNDKMPLVRELDKLISGGNAVDDQAHAAAELLKKTMQDYPNALFYLSGHSKGSMNVQYAFSEVCQDQALADRIFRAIGYQGLNIGALLSKSQYKAAQKNKHKLFLLVDAHDIVSKFVGKKIVGNQILFSGVKASDLGRQHMWGGYKFGQDGKLEAQGASVNLAMIQVPFFKSLFNRSVALFRVFLRFCKSCKESIKKIFQRQKA